MAILKNLIVNGSSRFLNTAYFQDVSIAGSAALASLSLSGNLSVTGTSTLSGNTTVGGTLGVTGAATFSGTVTTNGATHFRTVEIYSTTPYIDFHYNNSTADYTSRIIESSSGTLKVSNNLQVGSTLAAQTATINNATISGDLTVNGVLHSNEFIKNIVKAVGGQLYVSPTFQATSSTTISCASTDTSYVYLTLQDDGITSSEYAGATWYSGSRIMLSGTLTANTTGHTEEILFSSAPGELTAQMNGGTNGAKKLQIKVEYDNASTYFKAGNLTFSDVAVMMYQLKNGSNYFPIGIYIKAYGTDNQKSYIDIFGGSATTPNARLGLLTGLGSMPSGSTIQGWGIYTDNGFFKGIIEANGGLIGNWTIGTTGMYYNSDAPGSTSITMIPGGTVASTTSIGGSSGSKSWIFTGKNLFGIDTTGKLYASSAEISGKITATSGEIGGWSVWSNSFGKTTDTSRVLVQAPDSPTSGNWAIRVDTKNSDDTDWTNRIHLSYGGEFFANNAIISGKLTAGNGSKIGDLTIADGKLSVPAANITGTLSADHIDASSLSIGQSQVTGLSTALGNKADSTTVTALSNKVTAVYGTSNTAAGTAAKVVTCANFELYTGAFISVKFSTANTATGKIQLNINSKGAKDVWVADAVTGTTNQLLWGANAVITFRYDGTQFIIVGDPKNWYGASTTAAGTAAKTDTTAVTGCVICKGTTVNMQMTNANTVANPTLNIRSTGAKAIYSANARPAANASANWTAASTIAFVFDGQYWRYDSDASTKSSAAAKTATNYLYFDSTNGLVVSQTGKVSTGYNTQITSTGMNIRNGATTLASYGSSITLGKIANGVTRVQIDNDSLDVISRDNNGTDTTIATFGQTARIGSESGRNITINENGLTFNNNNSRAFYIGVESRVAGKSYLSETIVFHKSSGSMTQDNKTYYLLTTVPTDRTVTEVGWLYLDEGDGEEVLHAADDFHIDDWIIDNDKLWIHDDYIDDYDGRSFNYIYSSSASSIVDPYCVIGTYKYSSTNIAGSMSFAQGKDCLATGQTSTAIGYSTTSKGVASFSCGNQSEAQADYSFAGGFMSTASGKYSLAYGYKATVSGSYSTAFGYNTTASGDCSTAFGTYTTASGDWSTAFGHHTTASGNWSTAFGTYTTAGNWSTAFGGYTTASGSYSTAYGYKATASGSYSTAFGYNTTASNGYSTAFGYNTTASGDCSTAFGRYTKANMSGQTAIGTYNIEDTTPSSAVHPSGTAYGNYAFIIGNGKGDNTRSNALTVDWKGNVAASGKVADADGPLGVKVAIHKFTIAVSASGTGSGSFTLSTAEASGYLTTVITEVWPQSTWTNANANVSRVERSGNNINVHLSSMSAQTYNISAEVLYRG